MSQANNGAEEPKPGPECPRSGPDARRTTRGEKVLIVALGAVVVVCIVFIAGRLSRSRAAGPVTAPGSAAPAPAARRYERLDGVELGSKDAKVDVLAVLPLDTDCHGTNIEYLRRLAEAHPEHIHVRFVNFHSDAGQRLSSCAAIFIDGKEVQKDAAGCPVELTGPAGENYSLEDLRAVLQARLDQAYGSAAPQIPPTGLERVAQSR